MKAHPTPRHRQKGSALLTVVMFAFIMAALTASILQYSVSERRSNERERLQLRARNMSENVALYASEQITTKLRRLRSPAPIAFMTGTNAIAPLPDEVTTTKFSAPTDVECRAGLTSSTGLVFIDPTLAANASNPNAGLSVNTSTVNIIAKSTMTHPSIGALTDYAEQDLAVTLTPLFQFGVFYNMDMEYGPGRAMTVSGPVHTNGDFIARDQTGTTNNLQFTGRVTAAGGFFADTAHKGPTYMNTDTLDNGPGGTGALYFQTADTVPVVTNIYSGTIWRDHKWGTATATASTLAQFKTFATNTYKGNLRTSVHGVTPLILPAVGAYNETTNPTGGREIIEIPLASDSSDLVGTKISRNAGLYIVVNPDTKYRSATLADGSSADMMPRSYRCWLNTVNADGSHTLLEVILPGQPSWGYNSGPDLVKGTADDYMYQNNMPNRYTDLTAIGSNQILRIPASGRTWDNFVNTMPSPVVASPATATTGYLTTLFSGTAGLGNMADAFFYDLRRADNNTGHPWARPTKPYTPRKINKIDFDMVRFRLAVERTVTGATASSRIYNPNVPNSGNWANNLLNPGATTASYKLGINITGVTDFSAFPTKLTLPPYNFYADPFLIYVAPTNPLDPLILLTPNIYGLTALQLINTASACPWFDGISIYINSVDAEVKTKTAGVLDRIDSGVRLWNGRGPVISLNGATYPSRTGLTLATNDAVYIAGHFNADGAVNSTITDVSNPGGYSGVYPDSANEMLCAVMGDAITILSQPSFQVNGANYITNTGWSDSLSGLRCRSGGSNPYSTSWNTTNPSTSNTTDGEDDTITPANMPNLSDWNRHVGTGDNSVSNKLAVTPTEISTCLLTGIVHTTNNQTSGGVHNFPRLSESWSGAGLYIRGSMVAMFQSQVATEPWSISVYDAASRYWGLHDSLVSKPTNPKHDVPLEPIVLGAYRLRYMELTAAQYDATKTVIEALPH